MKKRKGNYHLIRPVSEIRPYFKRKGIKFDCLNHIIGLQGCFTTYFYLK